MVRPTAWQARFSVVLLGAALAGCSGSIGGTSQGGGQGHEGPGAGGSGSDNPDEPIGLIGDDPKQWQDDGDPDAAPALPLRLITRDEYDNTIAVIFTDEYAVIPPGLRPGALLPGETVDLSGFLAVGEVSEMHVLRYGEAAAVITGALAGALPKLVGCDLTKVVDDVACVRAFLPGFGELLYRRPLAAAEVDEHLAFYQFERTTLGQAAVPAALQMIAAMLQSPHFLYRWEQGWKVAEQKGNVVRLNAYQVASRLSFFLWNSGPDRQLLALARAGGLATAAQVVAQARKMLESPRAERAVNSFHTQWLGLAALDGQFKDPNRFPRWNGTLGAAMRREIETFARSVLLEGDGLLNTLLRAPYSYLNQGLAGVYGIAGITGEALRKVDLDPGQRAGLLTMPGLLAVSADASVANPFRRGKLVLDKILCRSLEPPAVIPVPPTLDPSDPRSEREVLQELTAGPACNVCHESINPFGFALGNFDAIGQFQTKDEAGKPVDASGTLPGTTIAFAGPVGLADALSDSEDVRACLAKQWFRFALARHEEEADGYSLGTAYKGFAAAEFNLREMLTGLVSTRSFLYRTLEDTEVVEVLP